MIVLNLQVMKQVIHRTHPHVHRKYIKARIQTQVFLKSQRSKCSIRYTALSLYLLPHPIILECNYYKAPTGFPQLALQREAARSWGCYKQHGEYSQ